ncbi:MFS general substrate transporter [Microthyrium microscopicum]|uniref:MFS general substrate transporter n=1 Tax=Microthyrium microscopicum TaxID=703497 RepID=A0A6A6TY85_9PEZI|nr:MFS general substrate transporter [Microthyrium microscopicum]
MAVETGVPEIEKGAVTHHEETPVSTPQEHSLSAGDAKMTAKTWFVIFILSSTFGLSFWPVPTTAAMQSTLGAEWAAPNATYWFIPAFTTACALGFLLAGSHSDLFGRRLFLLFGNAMCCVGFLVIGTAKGPTQFTAGLAITGFGAGFCQMSMCSIPELMPNKYRHIGITISDGFVFLIVVIGPVVGRYANDAGEGAWRAIYYAGFGAQFVSLAGIACFYFPPKHPKGVPWGEGLRGLDYVGAFLIVSGTCISLVGIINTTFLKSSDVKVVAPLAVGLGLVAIFGVWETLSNVKYKLCPPEIFRVNYGREFTAPFILAFIVTMYYYFINIAYPTMVSVFYITPTTSRSEVLLLTLPPNLGLVFGSMLLISFGAVIKRWRTTLTVAWTGMMVFGSLMALVTPYNRGLMIALTFLQQTFFGWAQYESVMFTQLGVHQHDLGTSGGLAGASRFAGGSIAQAIYTTILTNAQSKRAAQTLPAAAIAAGLSSENAAKLLAAFPLGAKAIAAVPGVNANIIAAASTAFQWSYAHGLKIMILSSLAWGGLGLILCLLTTDASKKMNSEINVYLENDVNKEKNEFH